MMVAKHNAGHLIALAAGGTGGHVFPAEALAQELQAQGHRLMLITDRRGAIFGGTLGQIETQRINAGALAGRGLLDRAGGMANLALGYFQARQILQRTRPSVVVGFGGYAAAPSVLAATNLRLPTVIHEQNAVLGRANRMLAPRVQTVCTSFADVDIPSGPHVERTGMPVRPSIAAVRDIAYNAPEQNGPFRLLIIGGSQGARVFSDVIPAAIAKLPRGLARRLEIFQQCRPEDLERVQAVYAEISVHAHLQPFFENMPQLLATTHLMIARSGSSTVAEVAVAGRPSVLVPYPYAADDHQTGNAKAIAAAGGAWLMPQDEFTVEAVATRLSQFLAAPQVLTVAATAAAAFAIPDAAARLATVVASIIRVKNAMSTPTISNTTNGAV